MGLSDGTETAIRQKKKGARADKRHRHPEFTILELREPKASGSSFFVKSVCQKWGVLQNTPTKKDEVRNRKRVSKPRLFA